MKIPPFEAELSHADRRTDGRTDMTKITVAFRNFANAPNYVEYYLAVFMRHFRNYSKPSALFATRGDDGVQRLN
jgi:hypothetical protein